MAGGKRLDRRGSGPIWFAILALVLFVLYSATVAWATVDDCAKGADRHWHLLPPRWECSQHLPGYG